MISYSLTRQNNSTSLSNTTALSVIFFYNIKRKHVFDLGFLKGRSLFSEFSGNNSSEKKKPYGFTLMEIMITIVMLGVLTAFALPNYFQAMERQRERTATVQLQTLHSANRLYHAQMNNTYLTGNWSNINPVNTALRISLTPGNSMTFAYNGNAAAFTATLSWPGKAVRVSQINLGPNNPCCVGGGCLTLGGC